VDPVDADTAAYKRRQQLEYLRALEADAQAPPIASSHTMQVRRTPASARARARAADADAHVRGSCIGVVGQGTGAAACVPSPFTHPLLSLCSLFALSLLSLCSLFVLSLLSLPLVIVSPA